MSSPVDATLIGQLLDQHAAALELYAKHWTVAPEDCVQEALIELARQPVAPHSPVAWLYCVVRNRALNAARSTRRRREHEQRAGQQRSEKTSRPVDPQVGAGLHDLLATLDGAEREIVVLRIWGQLTWQEIADVAGGSSSGAQRRYEKALVELRKHLEPSSCPKTNPCPTN